MNSIIQSYNKIFRRLSKINVGTSNVVQYKIDFLIDFYEQHREISEKHIEKPTSIQCQRELPERTYSDYSERVIDLSDCIDIERTDYKNLFKNNKIINEVTLPNMYMADSCESMFEGCINLEHIYSWVPYIKNSRNIFGRVRSFKNAFKNCERLDSNWCFFSSFDVSACDDFTGMFEGSNIEDIHIISNWNVDTNANFEGMFRNCKNIKSFECLENWFPNLTEEDIIEKVC